MSVTFPYGLQDQFILALPPLASSALAIGIDPLRFLIDNGGCAAEVVHELRIITAR